MTATLEYALVDGRPVHARRFVGVEPHLRPEGVCPCCNEVVVWKAGETGKVTPHVAHVPGSACASTAPETAEHLNAKMWLVDALSERGHLDIVVRCHIGHVRTVRWEPGWHHVTPEYRVGTRRPDVAMLDTSDSVVGAIEVRHTHAVDRAKAEALAALGVDWIEVEATAVLRWDGVAALRPVNVSQSITTAISKTCESCAHNACIVQAQREAAERIGRERRDAAEKAARKLAEDAEAAKRAAEKRALWKLDQPDFERREREREAQVAGLRANPPASRIAVQFAQVATDGAKGPAALGLVVMREGREPEMLGFIDNAVTNGEAMWAAMDLAVEWMARRAPGCGASIHTDFGSIAKDCNRVRRGVPTDDPVELRKRRIIDVLVSTNSLVVQTNTKSNVTDPVAARWLINLRQHLARELRRRLGVTP